MKKYIFKTVFVLVLLISFSCEEYLDIAPESVIDETDAFKNFDNAQGFVEEMYALIPDIQQGAHQQTDYLYGDDAVINTPWQPMSAIDRGELNFWFNSDFTFLNRRDASIGRRDNDPNNRLPFHRPGIWNGSLQGIRKANIAIANIDLMVDATQEEKDVILGQAYFLRAFFHFEIMKYWGRFPYIDRVLINEFELPRPETYRESALLANEDFKRAAELLPVDWDVESYGQKTLGDNKGRITKGAAYGYMGSNLLYAASPLMKGSLDTYDYDTELAGMAVDAFAEVLKIADGGRYALSTFENYEEVFWNVPQRVWPGGTEFIFNNPSYNYQLHREVMRLQMDNKISGGGSRQLSPTHNFIHQNFGMANGLSVQDDLSGTYGLPTFDPTKPFENRDPRFYKWITVNGDVAAIAGSSADRIIKTYDGGRHRSETSRGSGTRSGYFFKKFYPTLHSRSNNLEFRHTPWRLRMRLTDIYLMYAEALHASTGSATATRPSYNLTAEQVVNIMRDRAGVPNVNSTIVANKNKFMDELRRERSVELSFEAHRWEDIRRWVVAHLDEYRIKTGVNFDENYTYFTEFTLADRVCEYPKHYWLPFPADQTQLYEGFPQNPGW